MRARSCFHSSEAVTTIEPISLPAGERSPRTRRSLILSRRPAGLEWRLSGGGSCGAGLMPRRKAPPDPALVLFTVGRRVVRLLWKPSRSKASSWQSSSLPDSRKTRCISMSVLLFCSRSLSFRAGLFDPSFHCLPFSPLGLPGRSSI